MTLRAHPQSFAFHSPVALWHGEAYVVGAGQIGRDGLLQAWEKIDDDGAAADMERRPWPLPTSTVPKPARNTGADRDNGSVPLRRITSPDAKEAGPPRR